MIEPRDEGEVAQDYQERLNQHGISRVLAEARRPGRTLVVPICEDCFEVIPKDRLDAQPGATRCVVCQQLHDRLRGGM